MIICCTGNSNRHVRSIADKVGIQPNMPASCHSALMAIKESEWVLVDLGEVMVHVMQDEIRQRYQLEKLWAEVSGSLIHETAVIAVGTKMPD